jgi:hypothetical protein
LTLVYSRRAARVDPSQVRMPSFSEGRKPFAETLGHGHGDQCAWVWSPLPPGLSKEPGRREMSRLWFCCADQAIFVWFPSSEISMAAEPGHLCEGLGLYLFGATTRTGFLLLAILVLVLVKPTSLPGQVSAAPRMSKSSWRG